MKTQNPFYKIAFGSVVTDKLVTKSEAKRLERHYKALGYDSVSVVKY